VSTSDKELIMWVVYDHPSDYPDQFVARQHIIGIGGQRLTDRMMAASTLENIQAAMTNLGLVRIDRDMADDPVIVESWL
jgi:hypothetical protein